jgi:hypothetical protein
VLAVNAMTRKIVEIRSTCAPAAQPDELFCPLDVLQIMLTPTAASPFAGGCAGVSARAAPQASTAAAAAAAQNIRIVASGTGSAFAFEDQRIHAGGGSWSST